MSEDWDDSDSGDFAGELPAEGMEGEKGVRAMSHSISHTHGFPPDFTFKSLKIYKPCSGKFTTPNNLY